MLDQFLTCERGRPFSWRDCNCALWVADWIKTITGIDPAKALRGRADDAESWRAVLKAEGGFMPLIGWTMDRCGFERTQSPQRGDAAIVSVPGNTKGLPVTGASCVICVAPGGHPVCVARSFDGLHFERFPLITAWRVTFDPCRTTRF